MAENKVFDTKLTKGPPMWDGERTKWRHWSAKVEGYIAALDQALLGLMEIAAVQIEVIKHAGLQPEHIELSMKLYGVLNALTTDDAYETLLNCEKGNGLEVWRRYNRDNKPRAPARRGRA